MKISNPQSRFQLSIRPSDYVLEVGGGHNPHPRAQVVVDKYENDDSHRSGSIAVRKGQEFICADGENLPFPDKSFDYVICCHVLEHVENPARFLKELMRVAKRGYIELPSLLGEYLAPKASHTWTALELEGKLVLQKRSDIGLQPQHDFGDLFLYHLPKQSLAYRVLQETHGNLLTVRYEWSDSIDFEVSPTSPALFDPFVGRWTPAQLLAQFPERSLSQELWATAKAAVGIAKTFIINRLKGKKRSAIDHKIGLGIAS
jgi:SAM-dependent methyltransferase